MIDEAFADMADHDSSLLRIFVSTRDELDHVRLCGEITENNNLDSIPSQLKRPVVVLALREVTRINSLGVRDWVNCVRDIEKAGRRVVLYECSVPVVSQLNVVSNFGGNAHVESFMAPYVCPNCNAQRLRLIQTRRLTGTPPRVPRALCDDCDGYMNLDDIPESYFSFVAQARGGAVDTLVERALVELTPTIDTKLKRIEYTTRFGSMPHLGGVQPSKLEPEDPALIPEPEGAEVIIEDPTYVPDKLAAGAPPRPSARGDAPRASAERTSEPAAASEPPPEPRVPAPQGGGVPWLLIVGALALVAAGYVAWRFLLS